MMKQSDWLILIVMLTTVLLGMAVVFRYFSYGGIR